MAEEASWDQTLDDWLLGPEANNACYAAGMAQLEDGNFYAAAPVEGEAGWGLVFAEDYQEKCLQDDGVTEKMLDVWEGAGLKSAIETGKKPEWGFCLGGYKYNITQHDPAFEDGDCTFATLFAQRPKQGVFVVSTGSQIVAGFYSEEKGQSPGNCKKAVLAFATYLKSIGY